MIKLTRPTTKDVVHEGNLLYDYIYNNINTLESYGISSSNDSKLNAKLLAYVVRNGLPVNGSKAAYTFDFSDEGEILTTSTGIHLDMGEYEHTFINFPSIKSDTLLCAYINLSVNGNNGKMCGILKARKCHSLVVDTLCIRDVRYKPSNSEDQFFALEVTGSEDKPRVFSINNLEVHNVICTTVPVSAGTPVPMTVLGGYFSNSGYTSVCNISINNLHVENFYSVNDAGALIDGDSDCLRMFTHPTNLSIDNAVFLNSGKRMIKSQNNLKCKIGNLRAAWDGRFTPTTVFVSLIDCQTNAVNSNTDVVIDSVDFTGIGSRSEGFTRFYTASGNSYHTLRVNKVNFFKLGIYNYAGSYVDYCLNNLKGSYLSINAVESKFVINGIKDDKFVSSNSKDLTIKDFTISFDTVPKGISPIVNAKLYDGKFVDLKASEKVATFSHLENVKLKYSNEAGYVRAMSPVGGNAKVYNVTVEGLSSTVNHLIDGSGGGGTIVFRDYRALSTLNPFVATTGSWSVYLDNCEPTGANGSGVATKKVATYT